MWAPPEESENVVVRCEPSAAGVCSRGAGRACSTLENLFHMPAVGGRPRCVPWSVGRGRCRTFCRHLGPPRRGSDYASGIVEPVYFPIIGLARTVFALQGLKFTVQGAENIPAQGGAVIAINHTGYMDF